MNLLLTGFEPFDGSPINPSEQIANALAGQMICGMMVQSSVLPVDSLSAPSALISAIQAFHPHAVVCLGENSGAFQVALEQIAINLQDFRIPDNYGNRIIDQPVDSSGPTAYFSTLPVRKILAALHAAGIPADLSLSAGTYLCNQVFYTLMHHLASHSLSIPAGFIHLPSLPSQIPLRIRPGPSMSLQTSLEAVRLAIQAVAAVLDQCG